jgi:hypothetical protein
MDFIQRLVSQNQKIIDKELKTPKRPKCKLQNNKPEKTHKTQNQNTQMAANDSVKSKTRDLNFSRW